MSPGPNDDDLEAALNAYDAEAAADRVVADAERQVLDERTAAYNAWAGSFPLVRLRAIRGQLMDRGHTAVVEAADTGEQTQSLVFAFQRADGQGSYSLVISCETRTDDFILGLENVNGRGRSFRTNPAEFDDAALTNLVTAGVREALTGQ